MQRWVSESHRNLGVQRKNSDNRGDSGEPLSLQSWGITKLGFWKHVAESKIHLEGGLKMLWQYVVRI